MQSDQASLEKKLNSVSEALAFETKRREAVELLAVEAFKHRRQLEAQLAKHQAAEQAVQEQMQSPEGAKRRGQLAGQLAEHQQAQATLRQQLEESQKQLETQKEAYEAEQAKFEAKLEALQAEVQRMTESWVQRREGAGAEQSSGDGHKGGLKAIRQFVEGKSGLRR